MAIVRTYLCEDCGTRFDKLHFDRSEPAPECPGCQALAARQVPAGFAIGGNASKAGDLAYDIMSKEYGLSNMRDNLREGDIAVVTPPALQPALQSFWKPTGDIIGAAKSGAAAAKAEGSNPISLVQRAKKSTGMPARVLCHPVNMVR